MHNTATILRVKTALSQGRNNHVANSANRDACSRSEEEKPQSEISGFHGSEYEV
jgi:hypothetical protein